MDAFTLTALLTLNSSSFDSGLKNSETNFSNFGGAITGGIKNVAGALAGAKIVQEVVNFGKESVIAGMNFDSAMSQVAATMGTTTDQIQDLRAFALEMGSSTAFSATEAAEALNYMALAGYDAETSMKMLPTVLNLAAAGGMELARASDMVTDASSALGLTIEETEELVDKMAKTSSKTNTSVSQLGDAILTIGGTAKDVAGGTTELSVALGILADNGIKGSEGGTKLRNILLSLEAPTDQAAAKMEELGISVFDTEGKLRPLPDIFGDLNGQLSTMTQGERTQVLNELFNKTDLGAVNALLSTNVERWGELTDAIDNAQGSAQEMAGVQLDNLAGDITLFKSALEGAKIAISDMLEPAMRSFVQWATGAVTRLTEGFREGGLLGAIQEVGNIITETIDNSISAMIGQQETIDDVQEKFDSAIETLTSNKTVENVSSTFAALQDSVDVLWRAIDQVNTSAEYSPARMAEMDAAALALHGQLSTLTSVLTSTYPEVQELKEQLSALYAVGEDGEIYLTVSGYEAMDILDEIWVKLDALKDKQLTITTYEKIIKQTEYQDTNAVYSDSTTGVNTGKPNANKMTNVTQRYASAMSGGTILRNATIFGYNDNGLMMGGEAGHEAIAGVNSLDQMIQQSVNAAVGGALAGLGSLIEGAMNRPYQIVLDSGVLVGELAPDIDGELSTIAQWRGGGRA